MTAAQALYRRLGFGPIPPSYDSPAPRMDFLELGLERLIAPRLR